MMVICKFVRFWGDMNDELRWNMLFCDYNVSYVIYCIVNWIDVGCVFLEC